MFYKVWSFNRAAGTYVVQFYDPDHPSEVERRAARLNGVFLQRKIQEEMPPLNYPAPRLNGVYLAGQELEDAIQMLSKPYSELTDSEKQLLSPTDDPAAVTGGEDIEAKVAITTFTKF
jgi:hypothetical protein